MAIVDLPRVSATFNQINLGTTKDLDRARQALQVSFTWLSISMWVRRWSLNFPFWLNHACNTASGFQLKNHEVIQTNRSVGQAVEEGTQRTGKREVSNTWTTVSESLKHTSFTLTFDNRSPSSAAYSSSPPWSFMSCNFLAKQDMLRMRGRQPQLNLATDLYTTGTLCSSQPESGQPQRLLSSATNIRCRISQRGNLPIWYLWDLTDPIDRSWHWLWANGPTQPDTVRRSERSDSAYSRATD